MEYYPSYNKEKQSLKIPHLAQMLADLAWPRKIASENHGHIILDSSIAKAIWNVVFKYDHNG